MRRLLTVLALGAACATLQAAAQTLEVIPLRHRTAEQVIPALRPLVEPGGVLTGQSGQLIVRASPGNIAEIRSALEALDRPLRRLEIWVRFDDAFAASREALRASGEAGDRGTHLELRARESGSSTQQRVDQRVQVLEGGRAFISIGESRPVPMRQYVQTPAGVVSQQTIVVQEAQSGFEVLPRLAGDAVFLDTASGSIRTRLGEWTELGGISTERSSATGGIGAAGRASGSSSRRVWLRVEALD